MNISKDSSKIYVAGHRGMVGSALMGKLKNRGYHNLVTKTSGQLDLRDQSNVKQFFENEKPNVVILLAATVGGILANDQYPVDFLYDNLMIESNVIEAANSAGVEDLIFMGSSCIYPKHCPQPMKEEHLLTGKLEPTNQWYAIAKIAGIKLCQAFNKQYDRNYLALMPTNLYGPRDSFDLEESHVLPAFIHKFHKADDEVTVWGTGKPKREFLYVEDLAEAIIFLLEKKSSEIFNIAPDAILNVGSGEEVSINELAEVVAGVTGFEGRIVHDETKPDGTPRKLLDASRMEKLGWTAGVDLKSGIKKTYDWFKSEYIN